MRFQETKNVKPRVYAFECSMIYRLRNIVKVNTSMFLVSMAGEDPQDFLEGVYKVLCFMGVTSMEKVELVSYQFRVLAQVLYT